MPKKHSCWSWNHWNPTSITFGCLNKINLIKRCDVAGFQMPFMPSVRCILWDARRSFVRNSSDYPLVNYIAGWNIPIFNRKYIFKGLIFSARLVYQWLLLDLFQAIYRGPQKNPLTPIRIGSRPIFEPSKSGKTWAAWTSLEHLPTSTTWMSRRKEGS